MGKPDIKTHIGGPGGGFDEHRRSSDRTNGKSRERQAEEDTEEAAAESGEEVLNGEA